MGRRATRPSIPDRDLLVRVAAGETYQSIAAHYGVHPMTISRHVARLADRLRARNRTHLVTRAMATGALSVEEWSRAARPGCWMEERWTSC